MDVEKQMATDAGGGREGRDQGDDGVGVDVVERAYESSKLYRDLKLRGSIIRDNQLVLLPHEQQYSRVRTEDHIRVC